jgi:hypothetical protein
VEEKDVGSEVYFFAEKVEKTRWVGGWINVYACLESEELAIRWCGDLLQQIGPAFWAVRDRGVSHCIVFGRVVRYLCNESWM